ncbi:MAG: ChbG/HpnK family deacetylase [Caldimonas sp.]
MRRPDLRRGQATPGLPRPPRQRRRADRLARGAALKTLAFCVDDVGLVEGCADTVAALAAAGRICAASCVTSARAWRSEAAGVAAVTKPLAGFELGLHFNLSEGAPLSADLARVWPELPGLERLIALAHLGRLPLPALAAEFRAQHDAFADAAGRAPAFVDGHQHVHHLPGIRTLLLEAIAPGGARGEAPAVRNTGHVVGPGHGWKRMLIERTGGRALQRLLDRRGLRHNGALLGVYDFATSDYRRLVRGWLRAAPVSGGLVFCHPNHVVAASADPIGPARRREATYLASSAFADDLGEAGVSVGPAWPRSSSAG